MRHADRTRIASGGGLRQRLSAAGKTFLTTIAAGVMLGAAIMGAPAPALASPVSSPSEATVPSLVAPRSRDLIFTVSNGREETESFVYGDTIQINGTSMHDSTKSVALFYKNKQLTDWVFLTENGAGENSSFSITYDTAEKEIPVGEEIWVDVNLRGTGGGIIYSAGAYISLDKKSLDYEPSISISGDGNILVAALDGNENHEALRGMSFTWLRDGKEIEGAPNSFVYGFTAEDLGSDISVRMQREDDWSTFDKVSNAVRFDGVEQSPLPVGEGFEVDYRAETVRVVEGAEEFFELSADASDADTATSLSVEPGGHFYIRVTEANEGVFLPSPWTKNQLPARPDAPKEGVDFMVEGPADGASSGRIVAADDSLGKLLYRRVTDDAWTQVPEQGLEVKPGQRIEMRFAATDSSFASEVTTAGLVAPVPDPDEGGDPADPENPAGPEDPATHDDANENDDSAGAGSGGSSVLPKTGDPSAIAALAAAMGFSAIAVSAKSKRRK